MTACTRPGCGGNLDEDGFCDNCGLAAPVTVPADSPSGPTVSGATAPTVSSAGTAWTAATAPVSGASRRGSTRSSSRGLLGAGLVEVPRVAYRDPRTAVLANPEVPQDKRFCSSCGAKVGRGREDKPGRTEGFCTKCGHHYSFTPKLSSGDVLHDQYEVLGCLAHGGLGWIYLAKDRAVADRWVVLKGLLDTGDADAMAAAVAERQFLAEVEHPNIVKIHNFVQHRESGAESATGYIVMEYVGGRSLKEMIKERRREIGPRECLPLAQAIAYALEVLPAIGYLHGVGLLYCDFKPDNVIQTEEQLKLIDLGAVRRADDQVSAVYGTVGYQAPEIAGAGPSVESDIYTVGRALAVMTFPFDFHTTYRERLPGASEVPLLAEHESYHRLLLRATAADPLRRFGSAVEMKEQLTGVLREVLATQDGQPRPGPSTEFTPERRSFGVRSTLADSVELDPRVIIDALPVPRVDGDDPAAAFLATTTSADPVRLLDELADAPLVTTEVRLRVARAHVERGDPGAALAELDGMPRDWRVEWHRGLAALAFGRVDDARIAFDAVYDAVPGEAAPKLALAVCAEIARDLPAADRYYRLVWRTDRSYLSAAFGLARTLLGRGNRMEAVEVLLSVPESSNHYVTARLAAIRARTGVSTEEGLSEEDLVSASVQLDGLELDAHRRAQASRDLLEAAHAWVREGRTGSGKVLDCQLTDGELRLGLERTYRMLARQADTASERIALVDRANEIRPRTWV
jgi:serine/threonine-protein kinase PknG